MFLMVMMDSIALKGWHALEIQLLQYVVTALLIDSWLLDYAHDSLTGSC